MYAEDEKARALFYYGLYFALVFHVSLFLTALSSTSAGPSFAAGLRIGPWGRTFGRRMAFLFAVET